MLSQYGDIFKLKSFFLTVTKFEVSASIFSVTECDDPTSNNASGEFSFPLEGRGPISSDLTADVKLNALISCYIG